MKSLDTPWDSYQKRVNLWRRLCATVHSIWQQSARELKAKPESSGDRQWWEAFDAEKAALKADQCPAYDAWLDAYAKKHGVPGCKEAYLHILYIESWRRKNRPTGLAAQALAWEKQYFQLLHCQGEWIGMKASCCEGDQQPVAVPVGCNHRLCPLCNWHRSQNAQRRIKKLFDRFGDKERKIPGHPQFITLTVPNVKRITKRTFAHLRKRALQFVREHADVFRGGVYAIETTYNTKEKTWHVHVHALVDCIFALPKAEQRVNFAGRNMRAFDLIKLGLEYDWSRIWCKSLSKRPRKNANRSVMEGERWNFEQWVQGCFENRLKVYRHDGWHPITWLPEEEMRRRRLWNLANRRVIWVKPVDDREKAVKEVLKYITKSSQFVDDVDCVRQFYDATKGTRLIQCFGSWYGIDFSADFDTKHVEDDWKGLKCKCGCNEWHRIGLFQRRDVRMDSDGRWYLKRGFDHNARGTVPRPTIRALAEPETERTGDRPWETEVAHSR